MSDVNKVNAEADESALDRELEASIAAVKAGQTVGVKNPDGSVTPTSQTVETVPTGPTGESPTGETAPTGETGPTGEVPTGETSATGATGEDQIRIPNKGKFESDEAYEKRIELFDLVKARKAATTPEAKAALSKKISEAKGELKTLGGTERFIQPKTEVVPTGATGATGEIDPALIADKERLKALGGATKEDVEAIIAQTQHEAEVRSDLKSFIGKHAELKDEDVREVFFDFVDSNYVWQGKSGKELATTLELAYEAMFKPSETIQDRVLKGAKVAEKIGAMQFPGGTGSKVTHSPEVQKSIDELKSTGMSEEKAIELLTE